MSLPADDFLSAFHDGEVNSAERAVVEQRLATSAEACRELSEFRQVSALLKGLPSERLPSEFPQQVLQAIEREMLIPSERDAEAGPRTQVAATSAGSSRRWVGAVAVLTSAAGLLLLVRAIDDRSSTKNSEVRKVAIAFQKQFAAEDSSNAASFGAGTVSPPMTADVPASNFRDSGGAAGAHSIAANAPLSTPLPPSGGVSRESSVLFFDQSALRDAKIGDAVRAMQTEGTEVAVVWLTVVDRQEGLAGLQLLLGNNAIARANSDKKSDKAAKPNAAVDQMHAVFVESDVEQLTAMLKQLRESDWLQSVAVDQPIELAQLGDVQVGIEPLMLTRRFESSAPAATEKKIAKADQAGAKGVQDAKDLLAKQIPLKFSREALVQNQLSQQTRNRGMSRNQARSQMAGEKDAEKAPTEQRPMQVLFVVVDQSQAGKPQVSPNDSSKPTPASPSKARTKPVKPSGQDGAA